MPEGKSTIRSAADIKIGDRFGRLTVETGPFRVAVSDRQRWAFSCRCDCGERKVVRADILPYKRGVRSCGCLQRDVNAAVLRKRNTTHGLAARGHRAPEYSVWAKMRERCLNPNDPAWNNYGGRGIAICKRWNESFMAFYEDMGPRPTPTHSIERINNDKGYSPANCCWATRIEQANNQRKTVFVEHGGRRMSLAQWSRACGIHAQTIAERIEAGWSVAEALSKPPRSGPCILEYKGEQYSAAEWSRVMGISRETIYYRLRIGWSVSDALTVPPHHKRKAQ